ncbi:cadherin-related family member 2 [Synchiropus splendidus]|uniref:cadherin-related family member 2 n=1 Tax=Synchiropus splendidus TaxID=270530 RepID=UPI00237E9517|nr:cadherin-related family member 2 [Synchiropus splendidus]
MERVIGYLILLGFIRLSDSVNTDPVVEAFVERVCEDTPVGAYAFTIKATDPDGDPMTFSLGGPDAIYFSVEANTGRVSVARPLDRESYNLLELQVTVTDGISIDPPTVTGAIILSDANDNKPIFVNSTYDVPVPENEPVNSVLIRVQATDEDTSTAGVVRYYLDEVTPVHGSSLFEISPTTGDLKLVKPLNYTGLSTFYRLKIRATDSGGKCFSPETISLSSFVFSFISVEDVPDLNPQFFGLPYVARVYESSPMGLSVFQVSAVDMDTGVNDDIIYSIEDSDGLFSISSDDGNITVASEIDRETVGSTVILMIKATESRPNINGQPATATASVRIDILDINDNTPEFYTCTDETSCIKESNFTAEILEQSLGSVPINMKVIDLDEVKRIQLTLEGADKDFFSVEPQLTTADSVVQLLIKQPVDYEQKQHVVLQVIAKDLDESSFQSTATVTISIKDINDNNPRFPQDTYRLNVAEHTAEGTTIATITATDPDTMDAGKLVYSLLPESILRYFDVMPSSGVVYVKNQTLLDREVRSLYSATLQARDTDGKLGTTTLDITLTDINDQSPVFNRDSYLVFVEEGQPFELKIEATDADEAETVNTQIVYAIVPSTYSSYFTINPNTGVLKNAGLLDLEALDPSLNGKIDISVSATDRGSPPRTSAVPVEINLQDVNDNSPIFGNHSYQFSVKEGQKGASVGSVYAEDLDQTLDFNRISFSIIDGSFGNFIIRTSPEGRGYMGNIQIDPDVELDYESERKTFNLLVEATDLGHKTSTVRVKVEVLDVNDERPKFLAAGPLTVSENATINQTVGRFRAQDQDGSSSLIYQSISTKCRCHDVLSDCDWFMVETSGEVKVKERLDYEQCDQVLMEAQVVDVNTEKGANNSVEAGEMVINIQDINDNTPEFIASDTASVVVSETASKGTSVAGVTAVDGDSGVNRQIEFKVTKVQFHHANNDISDMRMLFEAVTTQQMGNYVGIIQTTEGLDVTLKGKYLVTVTATDTGGLSNSTALQIFTIDKSYSIELQFSSTQAEVEADLPNILRALTAATKAAVEVVSIKLPEEENRATAVGCVMVSYFVYSNGTALTSEEVERMLSHPDHFPVLSQLGLLYIGGPLGITTEPPTVQYILLGVVGGLIIVLIVLLTSLMCTRRNYRRKLKAAKAMKSASMVANGNEKSGAVVPGTNKYTKEGANPVLNLNIDTTLVLGIDEESSDVDKVSLNSVDLNYDMDVQEKDTKPKRMMEDEDGKPAAYIEPLSAALAERGEKKNSHPAYSNPAFSTTDL